MVKRLLLTTAFIFFLYPISIDGTSVNYSFAVLPLFFLIIAGWLKKPPELITFLILIYTFIFIVAAIYQFHFYDEVKRIISFLIFMSMFTFVFLRVNDEMIKCFKVAVVSISVFFSLFTMYSFFSLGGSALGFEAKDLVGGQRYGFIYLVAIWLVYFIKVDNKYLLFVKYSLFLILLIGLFLTFSRSSIIGLLVSFGLLWCVNFMQWLKKPNVAFLIRSIASVFLLAMLVFLVYKIIPVAFDFFKERLFSFLLDSNAVSEDLSDSTSSGGTRVYIMGKVFDFLARNPLTGSGYLGVWSLDDALFGSAHNQYIDVLFRTGLLWFLDYLFLLFLLLKHFRRNDKPVFWGLISVLLYGCFHETFKESQGGFLLAFLVGIMSQSLSTQDIFNFFRNTSFSNLKSSEKELHISKISADFIKNIN